MKKKVSKSAAKPLPPKPSATFTAPIFVPDYAFDPSSNSNNSPHFMPTPVPPTDDAPTKSTSSGPIIDLLNFPNHVNTSYMPNELDAIKHSIDSNHDNHKLKFTPNSNLVPEMINNELAINGDQEQPSGEQSMKALNHEIKTTKSPRLSSNLQKNPPKINIPSPLSTDESSNHAQDGSNYAPPKDLYNFPPNINSNYFPSSDVMVKSKNKENSYSPPESGFSSLSQLPNNFNLVETTYKAPRDLYNFPPNVDSNYLPPNMNVEPEIPNNSYIPPPSGNQEDNPNFDNPSPVLDQFLPPPVASSNSSGSVSGFDVGSMMENIPDSDMMPMPMPMATPAPPSADAPMQQYLPPSMSAPPAPMPSMMSMPPAMQGYQYLPPPPSGPPADFPKWQFDPHSDIIYDYDHHHHHHHDHDDTTTTTTVAPPEPEEPRVKKYSYYYLGRKLWYIPLYFTLWFCLYVIALIIRSIGRHKVRKKNENSFGIN